MIDLNVTWLSRLSRKSLNLTGRISLRVFSRPAETAALHQSARRVQLMTHRLKSARHLCPELGLQDWNPDDPLQIPIPNFGIRLEISDFEIWDSGPEFRGRDWVWKIRARDLRLSLKNQGFGIDFKNSGLSFENSGSRTGMGTVPGSWLKISNSRFRTGLFFGSEFRDPDENPEIFGTLFKF